VIRRSSTAPERLTLAPREAVAGLWTHAFGRRHDAIAVVGLATFANHMAVVTGISDSDDLR
jgi:hypothetical protein